ncbi:uncharacterized protein MYCFIDRAFT_195958 [Pseudocercospora fijiensis CIRAD86]|uniref:Uncharacterized protein n=1 Tax=Pseudocercospora fijiensis (strain CIRAD86) TaxID=383855 RepID=M3A1P8_PSEFD|nr:uncharacterized protein MYCFIDRAFT_195958 [Pseudocercospora fijiensis CIRAD86]EME85104.1 hypothetical protein MYCFIDRAFT_195958 [Pseudocercospora fijiensis CIRAD86]
MGTRSPTAERISHLSHQRGTLCQKLAATDIKYLDLGLEYHALPLQLRSNISSTEQKDCLKAFTISSEHDHDPDLIGYLVDMRNLCRVAENNLENFDIEDAEVALQTMGEVLEALADQLVALKKCVDVMHRRFSEALDAGAQFEDGGEYKLALRPEDGAEKFRLLRDWLLELPQVQGWLRSGAVMSEDEAVMMAVSAGRDGSEVASQMSLDWSEDERVPARRRKSWRRGSEREVGMIERR